MTPTVIRADASSGGLTTAWNNFLGLLPPGLLWVMSICGIALIVGVIVRWWWQHRHGNGAGALKGAPIMGIILGALLAAPAVIVPLLLLLIGGLITIVVAIANAFGMHLG